jgi:hypothetical protein
MVELCNVLNDLPDRLNDAEFMQLCAILEKIPFRYLRYVGMRIAIFVSVKKLQTSKSIIHMLKTVLHNDISDIAYIYDWCRFLQLCLQSNETII